MIELLHHHIVKSWINVTVASRPCTASMMNADIDINKYKIMHQRNLPGFIIARVSTKLIYPSLQ